MIYMKKRTKVLLSILIIFIILLLTVLPMTITIVAYNMNFGMRVSVSANSFSEDDFDMLREEVSFPSNKGQILRGYIYRKDDTYTPKALIVFSHGYTNTHNDYLNQIYYFVENGYIALAYDNTGCGMSDGDDMIGLAQSPLDLSAALTFVENTDELDDYKVFLYGHSWGGYAVTAVLNYGHKVDGVVSRSGFNNSRDMLIEYGKRLYGNWLGLLSPYAYVYEKIKFGDAVDKNGIKGINSAPNTPILLLHSEDDGTISLSNSLLAHKDEMINPDKIQTILYKDKTHDVVKTYEAIEYSKTLDENTVYTKDVVEKSHELDEDVMKSILDFYDSLV